MNMILVEPAYIIGYLDFERYLKGDIQQFATELEQMRIKIKEVSGFTWDNSTCRFSNIYGTEFKFSMHPDKENIHLTVWGLESQQLLYISIPIQGDRAPAIKKILEIADLWTYGKMHCSNPACNKEMFYRENAGHRFYAGIYCQECWDSQFHHLAATENYD